MLHKFFLFILSCFFCLVLQGRAFACSIPVNAMATSCSGEMCKGNSDEVKEGVGKVLYLNLLQTVTADADIDALASFANKMTELLTGKSFVLYAEDFTDDFVTTDFTHASLEYLIKHKINTYEKFTQKFKQLAHGARGCDVIFSTVDLWEGINYETYNAGSVDWTSYKLPEINTEEELLEALDRLEYVVTEIQASSPDAISEKSYENLLQYIYDCTENPETALTQQFNLNQTFKSIYAYLGAYKNYEYDFSDLRIRQSLKKTDNVFWTYIIGAEAKGAAAPVSSRNDYHQYVAYYGTESAYFLGQQYEGMVGIMYSLYGVSQSVNAAGNAVRGVIQQRGNLRTAISRNNLLNRQIEYNARLANNQRLAQDVRYQQYRQQRHGGDATDTDVNWRSRNIGKDPVQNQMKNEFGNRITQLNNVAEFRVNQTHSDVNRKALGLNRPDIQITYGNKRYYIEIDAATSNRGTGHLQRIIANDPTAASDNLPVILDNIIQGVRVKYNCTVIVSGRVVLIQMQ